jgi:DGQHR domain-containing protein
MIKKKRGSRKRKIDPQKLQALRQKRGIRALFSRIGFSRIPSDGIQFEFNGRTGELDDIFVIENILVIAEYTTGKATSAHVSKKSVLYAKILEKTKQWISNYSDVNFLFKEAVEGSEYQDGEYRVRIVYVSADGVSDEIEAAFPNINFLDGVRLRYFDALSKTIHKSSRHEFYKYLKLDFSEIGVEIHNSSRKASRQFDGYLLPEAHSSYPAGFKVVSFYADPETLLAISYVLRQDSWRDAEGLYQRILIKNKIGHMRRYLVDVKRVFVNNIIVTLPGNTLLNDPSDGGRNINPEKLEKVTQATVSVPYSANMIGLVDGQHRVFCYYEGGDPLDKSIAALRKRQNLLVTGLIFPADWSAERKRQFEAKLFLEINDNQARAKSALKQSIELILNPYSTIAIAKEIANRLSKRGPLAGLLQSNFFDPPEKIKTTSIVSYGLRPLVKLDGVDSLFSKWGNVDKARLSDPRAPSVLRKQLLDEYLEFCVRSIVDFMLAAMLESGPDKWKLEKKKKDQFLTPTIINGLFVCIRLLIENNKLTTQAKYQKSLSGLHSFPFSGYRSSGWKALGDKLYRDYFAGMRISKT